MERRVVQQHGKLAIVQVPILQRGNALSLHKQGNATSPGISAVNLIMPT